MKKSELTKREQKLISMVQGIGFGQMEFVSIKDGAAIFTEATQKVSNIKLSGNDYRHVGSRPDGDFQLKQEHLNLIETIRKTTCGMIRQIKVSNGLPTNVVMAEGVMS